MVGCAGGSAAYWDRVCGLSELHVGPHGQGGCRGARFRATGVLRWIAAMVVVALLAGVGIERWTAWELAGERRALEARAFELVTRAMAPGSTLACLDAVASSAFQEGCEKALFASSREYRCGGFLRRCATVAPGGRRDYAQRAGVDYGASLAQLRRNAEWDAFGIVAHVLAARDGCTAGQCQALAMLNSPQRVRANLARQAFDANVSRYAAVWATARRDPRLLVLRSRQRRRSWLPLPRRGTDASPRRGRPTTISSRRPTRYRRSAS